MGEHTVLCFGDSNTYGHDAATGSRFAYGIRWPGVLAAELGSGWRVIEEGLGGRTTVHDDPFLPHSNGLTYLVPCLHSHEPLDVVVLFLGLNDLKPHFGLGPVEVARGVRMLVEAVLESGAAARVLVLGTPRLADETAAGLPDLLRETTRSLGVGFLDLEPVTAFAVPDGRHLDAAGHEAVGKAVAAALLAS
jgi:lysophospholipase L1-like esterase